MSSNLNTRNLQNHQQTGNSHPKTSNFSGHQSGQPAGKNAWENAKGQQHRNGRDEKHSS